MKNDPSNNIYDIKIASRDLSKLDQKIRNLCIQHEYEDMFIQYFGHDYDRTKFMDPATKRRQTKQKRKKKTKKEESKNEKTTNKEEEEKEEEAEQMESIFVCLHCPERIWLTKPMYTGMESIPNVCTTCKTPESKEKKEDEEDKEYIYKTMFDCQGCAEKIYITKAMVESLSNTYNGVTNLCKKCENDKKSLQTLRDEVWSKHTTKYKMKCYCCKKTEITALNFEISRSETDNVLRPICSICFHSVVTPTSTINKK